MHVTSVLTDARWFTSSDGTRVFGFVPINRLEEVHAIWGSGIPSGTMRILTGKKESDIVLESNDERAAMQPTKLRWSDDESEVLPLLPASWGGCFCSQSCCAEEEDNSAPRAQLAPQCALTCVTQACTRLMLPKGLAR